MPGLIEWRELQCLVPDSDLCRLTNISSDLEAIARNQVFGAPQPPKLPMCWPRTCFRCRVSFQGQSCNSRYCAECRVAAEQEQRSRNAANWRKKVRARKEALRVRAIPVQPSPIMMPVVPIETPQEKQARLNREIERLTLQMRQERGLSR